MQLSRRRKCQHCREFFKPDPRNRTKQRYCSKAACRKASKKASQEKWLAKPENKNYFSGPEHVHRVQQWRKQNHGYRQKRRSGQKPLQDHSTGKTTERQRDRPKLTGNALQDLSFDYHPVFLGFLAHLSGSVLQDEIAQFGLRLQQLGQDILTEPSTFKGGHYDSQQTSGPATHGSPDSGPVQLDRPSSGA
jgi:hypothetical protein